MRITLASLLIAALSSAAGAPAHAAPQHLAGPCVDIAVIEYPIMGRQEFDNCPATSSGTEITAGVAVTPVVAVSVRVQL